MPVDKRRVDKKVLLPIALMARQRLKCDPEKWNDYEIEQLVSACGPEWASMSVENVRLQCCNFRKQGLLGTLGKTKNHGATIKPEPPEWYKKYLESEWWKDFREAILEFWEYKCCWCYSDKKLDVHHRTYERLGHEEIQDCVVLCRACHVMATRAQVRAKKNKDAQMNMFGT